MTSTAPTNAVRDQIYLFPMDGWTWAELFTSDGRHIVAPTPVDASHISDQVDAVQRLNPGSLVDELDEPSEIQAAVTFARSNWWRS